MEGNPELFRTLSGIGAKVLVVGIGHVEKALPQLIRIGSTQRTIGNQLDLVLDQHQVPWLPSGVHASRRIGQQQIVDAKHFHGLDRIDDLVHAIALVKVKTPLHAGDTPSLQFPEYELAFVARHGGNREMGNGPVRNNHRVINLVPKFAKPAAQDDTNLNRLVTNTRTDSLGGSLQLSHQLFHSKILAHIIP